MGLGKLQRFAKFEVADFIYYGNIREFVFKNWDKPKWGNPLLFAQTDFTDVPNVSYLMCNCCGATTTANWRFLRNTNFTIENLKFRGKAVKWGLKIFAPNYQKAQPYAKSGRTNRLAYVAVTLF